MKTSFFNFKFIDIFLAFCILIMLIISNQKQKNEKKAMNQCKELLGEGIKNMQAGTDQLSGDSVCLNPKLNGNIRPQESTGVPSKLQKLSKANLSVVAEWWRKAMQQEDYTSWSDTVQMRVIAAYGILFSGNYSENALPELLKDGPTGYNANLPEDWKPVSTWEEWCEKAHFIGFRQAFVNKVYASQNLRKLAYAWQKPELLLMFTEMRTKDKKRFEMYQSAINHMVDYLKKYNHHTELARLKKDPKHFTYDEKNPWRKLECWAFRRMERKEMTDLEILTWLKILKKDFGL